MEVFVYWCVTGKGSDLVCLFWGYIGSGDDWQDLVRQPDISRDPFLFERHLESALGAWSSSGLSCRQLEARLRPSPLLGRGNGLDGFKLPSFALCWFMDKRGGSALVGFGDSSCSYGDR